MRLGIMQPYLFPYLGYYELIARTDRWIVFDVVKYAPRSWMNRNRILHPRSGWQYFSVPVHCDTHLAPIKDVRLVDKAAAKVRLLGQLAHYRRKAPHYEAVVQLVHDAFAWKADDTLTGLTLGSLVTVCAYLGLPLNWSICSEMNLDLPPIEHPGQWALEICSVLGAAAYLNPPNGRAIFRLDEWAARGIEISFTELRNFTYDCTPYAFEGGLSILDVLMWVPPELVVREMGITGVGT